MKQPSIVPLNQEKHKSLRVKQDTTFAAAADQHLVALTLRECPSAASAMPIVFVKNPQSGEFHLAAVMGVDPQVNLFRQNDNWMAHHVPWNLQRSPFDIRGSLEQISVFIDENSSLIDEKEGIAIFDEEGKTTQYFEHMQRLLGAIAESEIAGREFLKILAEHELLTPIRIHVTYANDEQKNLVGMYGINEAKLNQLPDDVILSLMKSGGLSVIYAVLCSIGQLSRLLDLSKTSAKPLKNLRVLPDEQAQAEAQPAPEVAEEKPAPKKKTTRKKTTEK